MAATQVPAVTQPGTVFTLFASYKPRGGGVKAIFLNEDGSPHSEDALDESRVYSVIGFGKDQVTLLENQTGLKYTVSKSESVNFSVCPEPPDGGVGLSLSVAMQWEKQKTEKGCWFAAMAVIAGKDQQTLQTDLKWTDEELYSITMKEIPEFGQMIKCPVNAVDYKNIDKIYAAVSKYLPVILGVPKHVVVVYAVSKDKATIFVWDPADASLSSKTWSTYEQFVDSAYCASVG